MTATIAFQGQPGAYSDLACRDAYPGMPTLPCESFEAAIDAVRDGRATLAMLPCENSLAGRVPDIHHLLPQSGLFVVGEHFQRVEHCLLAPHGATIEGLKRAHSHAVALGQVRTSAARAWPDRRWSQADTAGAAATGRAMEQPRGRRDRLVPGRRDLRPGDPAPQRRGRRAQHHPLLRHGAAARACPTRRRPT